MRDLSRKMRRFLRRHWRNVGVIDTNSKSDLMFGLSVRGVLRSYPPRKKFFKPRNY